MFGGHDETQLLFMGQGILETRYNVFKILQILGFPMEIDNIELKVTADLKLSGILTGIQSCTSRHSCIYCQGRKSPQTGRWTTGIPRTYNNCVANYERWVRETSENGVADENQLKHYFSNKYPPIKIFQHEDDDTPFIELYPPPILHLLLGNYSSVQRNYTLIAVY